MSFFTQLFERVFKRDVVAQATQTQREALIDAFAFAVIADGKVTEEEHGELASALGDDVAWTGAVNRELYTAQAISRAEQAKASPQAAREHCRDIGQRLGSVPMREHAYAVASRIVCADGEVAPSERGLMSLFIQEFPIDETRALELSARAHREFELL